MESGRTFSLPRCPAPPVLLEQAARAENLQYQMHSTKIALETIVHCGIRTRHRISVRFVIAVVVNLYQLISVHRQCVME